METDTLETLRSLSARYGHAADSLNAELFVSVFRDDAEFLICLVPAEGGRDAVARERPTDPQSVIPTLRQHDKTFHFLGQSTYEVAGNTATGAVHCIAHHLNQDAEGTVDLVLFVRYEDAYGLDGSGEWKITSRRVIIEWSEKRRIDRVEL